MREPGRRRSGPPLLHPTSRSYGGLSGAPAVALWPLREKLIPHPTRCRNWSARSNQPALPSQCHPKCQAGEASDIQPRAKAGTRQASNLASSSIFSPIGEACTCGVCDGPYRRCQHSALAVSMLATTPAGQGRHRKAPGRMPGMDACKWVVRIGRQDARMSSTSVVALVVQTGEVSLFVRRLAGRPREQLRRCRNGCLWRSCSGSSNGSSNGSSVGSFDGAYQGTCVEAVPVLHRTCIEPLAGWRRWMRTDYREVRLTYAPATHVRENGFRSIRTNAWCTA